MNRLVLSKIFRTIKLNIPLEILNLVFIQRNPMLNKNTTIDEQITNIVIKGIVSKDCDLIKGKEINISLDKCIVKNVTYDMVNRYSIIDVPKSLIGNRSIITPLSIMTSVLSTDSLNTGSDISRNVNILERGMNAIVPEHRAFTTSNLELVGPNTILAYEDILHLVSFGILKVEVENESLFNNIKPKYSHVLAKLCLEACKSYIYNTIIIDMDKGMLSGGHELSIIKEKIDSYEDSYEEYERLLKEEWSKVAFMNDDKAYTDFIRANIQPIL